MQRQHRGEKDEPIPRFESFPPLTSVGSHRILVSPCCVRFASLHLVIPREAGPRVSVKFCWEHVKGSSNRPDLQSVTINRASANFQVRGRVWCDKQVERARERFVELCLGPRRKPRLEGSSCYPHTYCANLRVNRITCFDKVECDVVERKKCWTKVEYYVAGIHSRQP